MNMMKYIPNKMQNIIQILTLILPVEVCLPYSRLLTGIPMLAVFQNLRWNSNKTYVTLYNCGKAQPRERSATNA